MRQKIQIRCPSCGSDKVRKNGFIQKKGRKEQRYQCRNEDCGYIFGESSISGDESNAQ